MSNDQLNTVIVSVIAILQVAMNWNTLYLLRRTQNRNADILSLNESLIRLTKDVIRRNEELVLEKYEEDFRNSPAH